MKMDIFGNSANEDANMTNVESIESSLVIDKSVITILDSSKPEDKVNLGDVNADEKINVTDIAMTASHIKGIKALDDKGFKAADVNGDNKVNVTDIAMIASHIKGIKALG
ncbi:MAG: dockerin type I repeat-containing protein [Ruminococcus sp.]|nr:dockerin type I repeat-containing protein [Ruminococcus sp.]